MTFLSCRPRTVLMSLVLALSLFVSAAPAFGQSRQPGGVSVTVAGGVNVARLSIPFPDFDFEDVPITLDNGSRTGFAGGVLVDVTMTPRAGFTTGALYSERGAKMDADVLGFGVATIDFRMTYVDVPLFVRFNVAGSSDRGFSVLAGALAGIRMHARTKISALGQSESETFTDELPVLDFGVTIGGRADFGRGSVTAYYTHGLTDLTKGLSPDPIKHRVATLLAGWRF